MERYKASVLKLECEHLPWTLKVTHSDGTIELTLLCVHVFVTCMCACLYVCLSILRPCYLLPR